MGYRKSPYVVLAGLVLVFFPIIIFFESVSPTILVSFYEELLGRAVPLLIFFSVYRHVDSYFSGVVAGLSFGFGEILLKLSYGLEPSFGMLIPVVCVHVINGILISTSLHHAMTERRYSIAISVFFVAVLWHWLYNSTFYVT